MVNSIVKLGKTYEKLHYIIFSSSQKNHFFITKIITHFYGGLFWLLNSKEHTNFSLKLDAENLKATLQNLHNFTNIDESLIESFISFSRSIKPDKKTYKNIFKTIDLDFKSKWDYRLIPFSILFGTDVNNVYEFGFDQGRLPLLISKYIESHNIENKRYIGVDFNTRKGVLIPESKYIEIHPKRVEDFLQIINLWKHLIIQYS